MMMIIIFSQILYILITQSQFLMNDLDAHVQKLINSQFQKLSNGEIQLQWMKIGQKGAEYMSKKDEERVKRINLWANQIKDYGCGLIINTKWINLHSIDLGENKLTNKSCKFISKAKWPHLKSISVGFNQIGLAGLIHLAKSQFKDLNTLNVSSNKITAGGMEVLSKGNWRLESFFIYYNRVYPYEIMKGIKSDWSTLHTFWAKPQDSSEFQVDSLKLILTMKYPKLASFQ